MSKFYSILAILAAVSLTVFMYMFITGIPKVNQDIEDNIANTAEMEDLFNSLKE